MAGAQSSPSTSSITNRVRFDAVDLRDVRLNFTPQSDGRRLREHADVALAKALDVG